MPTPTIQFKPAALTEPTFFPTTTASIELSFAPIPAYVCYYSVFIPIFSPPWDYLLIFVCIADDPSGDPKIIGDPYCTAFVGRLSHLTTEETLRQVPKFWFFLWILLRLCYSPVLLLYPLFFLCSLKNCRSFSLVKLVTLIFCFFLFFRCKFLRLWANMEEWRTCG